MGSQKAGSNDPSQVTQARNNTHSEQEHGHLGGKFRMFQDLEVGHMRVDLARKPFMEEDITRAHRHSESLHDTIVKRDVHLIRRKAYRVGYRIRFGPENTTLLSSEHQFSAMERGFIFFEGLKDAFGVADEIQVVSYCNTFNSWVPEVHRMLKVCMERAK